MITVGDRACSSTSRYQKRFPSIFFSGSRHIWRCNMPAKIPLAFRTTETGCHEVISHQPFRRSGYVYLRKDGRQVYAHRLAWEVEYGPIPKGTCVCHICDNPLCINPEHLFLGTHTDNMNDMVLKGRTQHGERRHSAKLTEDQVREIRQCRYWPQRELSNKFGVSQSTISVILAGKKWKHV